MTKLLNSWEDDGLCTGCRTCVLICSFHHTGSFAPSEASIQIRRSLENGRIVIELHENCDRCIEKETPVCLGYCPRDCLELNPEGYPSKPQ